MKVRMEWNGSTLAIIVDKPLTQEMYDGLKISPHSLAYLLLHQAADETLADTSHSVTIEEVQHEH